MDIHVVCRCVVEAERGRSHNNIHSDVCYVQVSQILVSCWPFLDIIGIMNVNKGQKQIKILKKTQNIHKTQVIRNTVNPEDAKNNRSLIMSSIK